MAQLEAIVVNPPKEKRTYTYSEEDIKAIIQEAINKGGIALPAGGTRLFLHTISFNGFDNYYVQILTPREHNIVSEDKTIQQNLRSISNLLVGDFVLCLKSLAYDDASGNTIRGIFDASSTSNSISFTGYSTDDNDFGSITITNIENIFEEVIEL